MSDLKLMSDPPKLTAPTKNYTKYTDQPLKEAMSQILGLERIRGPVTKEHVLTAALYAFAQEEEILNPERCLVQSATLDVMQRGEFNFQVGGTGRNFRDYFPEVSNRLFFARRVLAKLYGSRAKAEVVANLRFVISQLQSAINALENH